MSVLSIALFFSLAAATHSASPATQSPPATIPPAASAPSAAPAAPLDAERLGAMLAHDDAQLIVQSFRRHPGEVLPFIDSFLEGGLRDLEKGGSQEVTMARFRMAVKFAELADKAFGEGIFTEYAAGFASWNRDEQKSFREGQKLFREGRENVKESPDQGIALFRKGLARAEPLGDHWGVAMCQQAIAETCLAQKRFQEGQDAALKAVELYGRLQLRGDYIDTLLTCATLRQELQLPDQGVGQFRLALQAIPRDGDPKQRAEIVARLCAALEKIGRKDEADKVRQTEAARGG